MGLKYCVLTVTSIITVTNQIDDKEAVLPEL